MRRPRGLALLLALAPGLVGFGVLEKRDAEVEAGNGALKAGKPDDALAHYEKAIQSLPADPGAHFDRGAALYALSRFDEAGQEFLRATEAKDAALKASAFYNLGNAFFKKDKFKESVAAYTRALGLRPDDERAKWNLEIALRKQKQKEEEEKKKQDQDQKDDQKNKDQDKKNDQKNDQKNQKPEQPKKDQGQSDQGKQKEPPKPTPSDDQRQIESVLDNLERSSKDLEKERARAGVVRTAPPAQDW